jgi:hypothetical protein
LLPIYRGDCTGSAPGSSGDCDRDQVESRSDGNTIVFDSYDSADPLHSTNGRYDPAKRKAGGDLASAEGIIGVGNANVNGHLRTGPTGTYSVGPSGFAGDLSWTGPGVQPGWFTNDFVPIFPDVAAPFASGVAPPSGTGTNTLELGNLSYYIDGDLALHSGETLYVTGNAFLYVTGNLNMSGTSFITIAQGASLRLYVGGQTATFGNINSQGPAAFQYYGLPANTTLTWSAVNYVGTVYAPQANANFSGGTFDGACILRSVRAAGSFQIHHE